MKIYKIKQRTPEWEQIKLGKFSASSAWKLMSGKTTFNNYIYEKLAEILTGKQQEVFQSDAMLQGILFEDEARDLYKIEKNIDIEEVGFIETDEFSGFSPDGIIRDENGLIEIKCPQQIQHARFLTGDIEKKYIYQMNFEMLTGYYDYVDFVSYNPDFPEKHRLYIQRFEPDEKIQEKMKDKLDEAVNTLKELLKELKEE